MARYLDYGCGIVPQQVDLVFLTHFHADHRRGLEAFPNATWLMADDEIAYWWEHTQDDAPEYPLLERLERADDRLADGVELFPTPGHTPHHTGLSVSVEDGLRVVVAGDAVMSRAHYLARQPYADKAHWEAALRTMDKIMAEADIVIPGHDNYFCTHLLPERRTSSAQQESVRDRV
jgi:glyoxylase-like metal-dependent hydrolase (beta-lactamase superfamily II)